MSETYKVYASQDYVQEQLKSVQIEVDTTLTASGKAADAKTVGDALVQIESKIDDVRPITNKEVDAIFSAAGLILPAAKEVGF